MIDVQSPGVPSPPRQPRVVAVLATRNEERFIAACLENLFRQGVEVYLCDNGSTDRTVEIATGYLGAGLIGIEHIPYDGTFQWESILRRKEALFRELDTDWLMHVDADEIHLPPPGHASLASAIAAADAAGYHAVEFAEFTFVPTREAPDHDHADYVRALRTYYPFRPRSPHCVRAYRKQDAPMEIAWSGGHRVRFPHEPTLYPEMFRMKHYLFLSAEHAARKYPGRKYRDDEVNRLRWHGWRSRLRTEQIVLPSVSHVRTTMGDDDLDPTNPWTQHWLDQCIA
jgi:glycosyltransferase involved in cell wall biosynthesis